MAVASEIALVRQKLPMTRVSAAGFDMAQRAGWQCKVENFIGTLIMELPAQAATRDIIEHGAEADEEADDGAAANARSDSEVGVDVATVEQDGLGAAGARREAKDEEMGAVHAHDARPAVIVAFTIRDSVVGAGATQAAAEFELGDVEARLGEEAGADDGVGVHVGAEAGDIDVREDEDDGETSVQDGKVDAEEEPEEWSIVVELERGRELMGVELDELDVSLTLVQVPGRPTPRSDRRAVADACASGLFAIAMVLDCVGTIAWTTKVPSKVKVRCVWGNSTIALAAARGVLR